MSWSQLARVAPPTEPVISVAAAREHARVDDAEDLGPLIAAATAMIDGPKGIGIAMVTQTWRYSLDHLPASIVLPLGPVQSIASISYVDGAGARQTLPADAYSYDLDADPVVIVPAFGRSFPTARCEPGSVKVTFVAGFGEPAEVPADLVAAVKVIVARLYDDRDTVDFGQSVEDVFTRYRAGLFV